MAKLAASDAVLTTLLTPFRAGALPWSQPAAFLNAQLGGGLNDFDTKLVCEQSFKPDADALMRAGFTVSPELLAGEFALVLVLPPRQREQARALLARALRLAGAQGVVVAASANTAGARTHEADLERLCGGVETLSKNKCRVFWSTPAQRRLDEPLMTQWLTLDAPRPILKGRFISRPGVFAWDRIDPASELLAAHLPASLSGVAADLGVGFGYLSDELLRRCAGITALDMYEAEARALELAKRNLARVETQASLAYHWHDVTSGLPKRYDTIITNPPFHTSAGADDPGLGRKFIAAAAAALNPGGRLFLVANRHLPYEDMLDASFGKVNILVQRFGFKIIEATRALGKVR